MHKTMTDPDLRELSVAQLRARRRRLARAADDPQETLRGTLAHQSRRCGRAGCRCARGEQHGPYLYLAVRPEGVSRSVYVPASLAGTVAGLVEATGRHEEALAGISQINLELLRRRALG